jgi:hypothetical protein
MSTDHPPVSRARTLDNYGITFAQSKAFAGVPHNHIAKMLGCHIDQIKLAVDGFPAPEPVKLPTVFNPPPGWTLPKTAEPGLPHAVREILTQVGARHGFTAEMVRTGRGRRKGMAEARKEAMWRVYDLRQSDGVTRRFSLPQVAKMFGLRDHTSVRTAILRHNVPAPQDVAA